MNLECFKRFPPTERDKPIPNLDTILKCLSQKTRDRILLQEKYQKTGEDEAVCLAIGDSVNEVILEEIDPNTARLYTEHYFPIARIGTFFSDLGKTGPANASPEEQELITRLYSIEKQFPKRPEFMSMRDFLELADDPFLYDNIDVHIAVLTHMGLGGLNVREFINLHAGWTWDILREETHIPVEARMNAALHHIFEGNNPQNFVETKNEELWIPRAHRAVGIPEIMTAVLDKYQARRRFVDAKLGRKRTHAEQIAWLRQFFKNPGWVKLEPYPEWLRGHTLHYIDLLEKAGPFPEFFSMDKSDFFTPSHKEKEREEVLAAK